MAADMISGDRETSEYDGPQVKDGRTDEAKTDLIRQYVTDIWS